MAHNHMDERREIVDKLGELLRVEANRLAVRNALVEHEPADIAEALDDVSDEVRHAILQSLDIERRAEVLDEVHEDDRQEYVEEAPVSELVELLDAMPADEAADILEHVDEQKAASVMAQIDPEHAEDVRELREYEPETAGGIMTTEFFWARPDETAAEVLARLKGEVGEVETAHEIFVCREDMKLKGQIPVETLLGAEPDTVLHSLMEQATITVGPRADQELAARYMQKYDLDVMAVIDPGRRLLGIITVDDIIDVLSDEASEDMYRMAGVGDTKPLEHGTLHRAYKRLPWLVTTIVGMGIIAPFILDTFFEETLRSVVALALFIPAIMGLGGNTAIQCSTITVRGLGTGELDWGDLWWLLAREVKVGFIIAITCSLVVGACACGILSVGLGKKEQQAKIAAAAAPSIVAFDVSAEAELPAPTNHITPPRFGMTVAIALFFGIMLSVLLGVTIPMVCYRMGVDPAVAAGPFITTLIDISTQTLYLGIATWVLLG